MEFINRDLELPEGVDVTQLPPGEMLFPGEKISDSKNCS
jgi:hypothetical protein